MEPTRQRILSHLSTHRVATARDLSQALQMTAANVRYHLAILQQQGQIEEVGLRSQGQRGRPSAVYSLAIKDLPLRNLCAVLLNHLLDDRSGTTRAARLRQIATSLQAGVGQPGDILSRRLFATIQRLNELHYQARWEAHASGPRIILGRCPYSAIIADHPELCQMDAYLLEGSLNVAVTQLAKLEPTPDGSSLCLFTLGETPTKSIAERSLVKTEGKSGSVL